MSKTTDPLETKPKSLAPDDATPASLGGSAQPAEIEPSPLERLIAQSTSEQAAAAAAAASPFLLDDGDEFDQDYNFQNDPYNSSTAMIPTIGRTLATLVAGSLCLLHMGLVWGSFLSNSWFETHMTISVAGYSSDQLLQKSTLASLLSMLLGNDQGWPAMILVLTCLIVPCLCMILNPSWTVGDYQADIYYHATTTSTTRRRRYQPSTADIFWGVSPRRVAEFFLIRLPFLAFFLLVVMDVGTSSLTFESNHTEFIIHNKTMGGLVSYTLGVTCALGVVIVLRLANLPTYDSMMATSFGIPPSPRVPWQYNHSQAGAPIGQPLAPPSQAFELQRPLLPTGNGEDPATWVDEEQTNSDVPSGDPNTTNGPESNSTRVAGIDDLPLWKKMLVFEIGILTAALWIPALFLPLFEVNFDGIVAGFMNDPDLEIHLYQFPHLLWQNGVDAGTDQWILIALGVVLISLVFVLPMLATGISLVYWRSTPGTRMAWFYEAFLRLVQPCLGGVVLSLALTLAVPTLEPLGDYVFNSQTSGFCQKFENITNSSCLTIQGSMRLGHWFLLAQSVLLEMLILLILAFKSRT